MGEMPEIKVLQTIEITVNSVMAVIIISKADKVTSLFSLAKLNYQYVDSRFSKLFLRKTEKAANGLRSAKTGYFDDLSGRAGGRSNCCHTRPRHY
jgi:hypothetical protein